MDGKLVCVLSGGRGREFGMYDLTHDVLAGERTGEICLVDVLCYKI
jgi:hypothetical protein